MTGSRNRHACDKRLIDYSPDQIKDSIEGIQQFASPLEEMVEAAEAVFSLTYLIDEMDENVRLIIDNLGKVFDMNKNLLMNDRK